MSYDLISYIRYEKKVDLNEQIISFFRKYGFNILLHPKFDLLKCDGLNPFVIKKESEFWKKVKKAPSHDILTGQEWYIRKPVGEDEEEEKYFQEKLKKLPPTETDGKFESYRIVLVNRNEITEYCTNFIFSGALIHIFCGMIEDPQLGKDILGDQVDKFLQSVLCANMNEDFSTAMPFEGWL